VASFLTSAAPLIWIKSLAFEGQTVPVDAQPPTPGIFIHPYLRPPLSPLSVASFFVAASPITPLDDSPDYLVPCMNACISSKVSLPSLLVSIALKIRS